MSNRLYLSNRVTFLLAAFVFLILLFTAGQFPRDRFAANIELVAWTKVMLSNTPTGGVASLLGSLDTSPPPGFVPELLLSLDPKQQTHGDIEALTAQDPSGQHALSLALFFGNLGETERANAWWAQIEQIGVCPSSFWYYRGQWAEKKGNWEEAISNYEKAATFPITVCDHFGQSDGLYRVGEIWQDRFEPPEFEKAASAHRRAAEIDDFKNWQYRMENYYRLGQTLFALGSNDAEAIAALNKAVEMRPQHSWTNLVLGRAIYRHSGDFELAEHYLQVAYELGGETNWQFPFFIGKLYEAEGLLEEARTYYLAAQAIAPDHPRVIAALDAMNSRR